MRIKNFSKLILMERQKLEYKDKMTSSQFSYIVALRKKQIGKVKMSYEEMKRFLTKKQAATLIELLVFEYYDIDVKLKNDKKPKKLVNKRDIEKQNNLQTTATRLDMFQTQLMVLNNK